MIYNFINLSSTKFSLNGVTFWKTFLPFSIDDQHIRIFNIYDSNLNLVERTNVENIQIDGVTYATSTLLINDLHDILYSRSVNAELDNAQIAQNSLAINELQQSLQGVTEQLTNYYTQQQVDNLINGLGANSSGIASGIVDGNLLKLYNNQGQLQASVNIKQLKQQGIILSYQGNGTIRLTNEYGELLSEATILSNELFYDVFQFVDGISKDFSDLVITNPFTLVKTTDANYYFISLKSNSENFQGSRIYINDLEEFVDLESSAITNDEYEAWEISIGQEELEHELTYRFNFWIKESGISAGASTTVDTTGFTYILGTNVQEAFESTDLEIENLYQEVGQVMSYFGDRITNNASLYWISGYTFGHTLIQYRLNDSDYTIQPGTITLDEADSDDDRIDVFALNDQGSIEIVKGTPAPIPVEETLTTSQLRFKAVRVIAGSIAPNVTEEVVYSENLGEPGGEWDFISSETTPAVDYATTSDVYSGTYALGISLNGTYSRIAVFENGNGIGTDGIDSFNFWIKRVSGGNRFTSVRFYGSEGSYKEVTVGFKYYTIFAEDTNDWQLISIPASTFAPFISGNTIIKVLFYFTSSSGFEGYLDDIKFITGLAEGGDESLSIGFSDLTGNPEDNLALQEVLEDKIESVTIQDYNGNTIYSSSNLKFSDSFRIDGNAEQIKLKTSQKTISSSLLLDDSYDNCIVKVKSTATITIPSGLATDFNCVFRTFSGVTATFEAATGVTFDAPNGVVLEATKMATLFKDGSTETYVLEGELVS